MSILNTPWRVLGMIEGHEEGLAKTASNLTSVSESQAKHGLERVQELVEDHSGGRSD